MISEEEKKLLTDIQVAINSIDEHLDFKKDFNIYIKSKTKQRAVERELEIIGEAMNKLLKINPETQISYAKLMVDLRNKVIHSYDNVNHTIIWKIINKDIPILKTEVENLLN